MGKHNGNVVQVTLSPLLVDTMTSGKGGTWGLRTPPPPLFSLINTLSSLDGPRGPLGYIPHLFLTKSTQRLFALIGS